MNNQHIKNRDKESDKLINHFIRSRHSHSFKVLKGHINPLKKISTFRFASKDSMDVSTKMNGPNKNSMRPPMSTFTSRVKQEKLVQSYDTNSKFLSKFTDKPEIRTPRSIVMFNHSQVKPEHCPLFTFNKYFQRNKNEIKLKNVIIPTEQERKQLRESRNQVMSQEFQNAKIDELVERYSNPNFTVSK